MNEKESYPSDYEVLKRIKVKLNNHDKSLFTAFELNLLRDIVDHMLRSNTEASDRLYYE